MHSLAEEIRLCDESGVLAIEHSVLKLDGFTNKTNQQKTPSHSLCSGSSVFFVSSLSQLFEAKRVGALEQWTNAGSQLLLSDEAYRIVQRIFPDLAFLSCHYHSQITLGNLTLELLPSGNAPGSSMLWLSKRKESMLFANWWSKRHCAAFRKNVAKKADILVVNGLSQSPFHEQINRSHKPLDFAKDYKKETERFLDFTKKLLVAGERVIVPVDAFGEVQRLSALLAKINVRVEYCSKLFSVMNSWRDSLPTSEVPFWLKNLNRYHKSTPKPSNKGKLEKNTAAVVFISRDQLLSWGPSYYAEGIWIWIGSDIPNRGYCQNSLSQITFADCFNLTSQPSKLDLLTLIAEVMPNQVILYGVDSSDTVHWLNSKGVDSQIFVPTKTETLF